MGLLLRLLAKIPTPALYPLGWLFYQLVYRVARYRRRTVRENLRHAFPDRSTAERARIERDSYRHLANLFLEIIRGTAMAQSEFSRRVSFRNLELLYRGHRRTQAPGHRPADPPGQLGVDAPRGDGTAARIRRTRSTSHCTAEFWDDYMLGLRSRFGAHADGDVDVGREVIRGRRRKRLIVMLADQAGPGTAATGPTFSIVRRAFTAARTSSPSPSSSRALRPVPPQAPRHYEIVLHEHCRLPPTR
jgi:KDO2-lipid IV(A) lauroyltransferase